MKLLIYNIISLNWFDKRECLVRRVGLEPTSSGHEPGMFPFTIPQKKTIPFIKKAIKNAMHIDPNSKVIKKNQT
jgi:hypothetical protein